MCENVPDVQWKSGKLTMAAAGDVGGKLKGHSTAIKTKLRVKWEVENGVVGGKFMFATRFLERDFI